MWDRVVHYPVELHREVENNDKQDRIQTGPVATPSCTDVFNCSAALIVVIGKQLVYICITKSPNLKCSFMTAFSGASCRSMVKELGTGITPVCCVHFLQHHISGLLHADDIVPSASLEVHVSVNWEGSPCFLWYSWKTHLLLTGAPEDPWSKQIFSIYAFLL